MTDPRQVRVRVENYMPHPITDLTICDEEFLVVPGAEFYRLTIAGIGERKWTTSEVAAFCDGLDTCTRIASTP